MVKKRELGFVRIILEPAKNRIENDQCPVCAKPKNEWTRRTDWMCCSTDCTSKFEAFCIIRSWPILRDQIFKRDYYRCKMCKKIPTKDVRSDNFSNKQFNEYLQRWYKDTLLKVIKIGETQSAIVCDDSRLIADHIIAIALGGKQWDKLNIQTLCEECNKIKTKEDAAEIAKLRREEKLEAIGQKLLVEV